MIAKCSTQAVCSPSSIEGNRHTIVERVGGRSPLPWIAWDVKVEGIFLIDVCSKVLQPAGSCIGSSTRGETQAQPWVEIHRSRSAEMTGLML